MSSDKPLEEIYKGSFFGRRDRLMWRVPIVCGAIAHAIEFNSVIDVGCAIGDLVQGYVDLGKCAHGIEGSRNAEPHLVCSPERVFFRDLRYPLDAMGSSKPRFKREGKRPLYGLVTCLEVAEHVEQQYAKQLVITLTELSDKILISAAPPGQKGHHHVNCQIIEYWDHLFAWLGYVRKDEVSEKVKAGWKGYGHKAGIKAYEQNLHYYEVNDATANRRNYDGHTSARGH